MKENYSPSEGSITCRKCGKLIKKGYAFCPLCGTKIIGIEFKNNARNQKDS